MIGSIAARVPSRNCSPPALMPETIALVRSCGDIGTSPLRMWTPRLASYFAGDFLGRADDLHGGPEVGELAAQTPTRLLPCLFRTNAVGELHRPDVARLHRPAAH